MNGDIGCSAYAQDILPSAATSREDDGTNVDLDENEPCGVATSALCCCVGCRGRLRKLGEAGRINHSVRNLI